MGGLIAGAKQRPEMRPTGRIAGALSCSAYRLLFRFECDQLGGSIDACGTIQMRLKGRPWVFAHKPRPGLRRKYDQTGDRNWAGVTKRLACKDGSHDRSES